MSSLGIPASRQLLALFLQRLAHALRDHGCFIVPRKGPAVSA